MCGEIVLQNAVYTHCVHEAIYQIHNKTRQDDIQEAENQFQIEFFLLKRAKKNGYCRNDACQNRQKRNDGQCIKICAIFFAQWSKQRIHYNSG